MLEAESRASLPRLVPAAKESYGFQHSLPLKPTQRKRAARRIMPIHCRAHRAINAYRITR